MIINLNDLSAIDKQHYLQHIVAPRPICFASTIDKAGNVNLSPFSFFNLFSITPPVVIFSPSRRVRDNTTKHTLENILEVPEVAINIVDYDMIQQTSLASCEYPKGINEFDKAGFTIQQSNLIKPPMVKESKAKMECRVVEVKSLGTEGGAGNLVICEILQLNIDEEILDDSNKVDQRKLKHVARLGGDWYCKVDTQNLFEVEKPNIKLGMGIDALPDHIRHSKILTGNELAALANVISLPEIDTSFSDPQLIQIHQTIPSEKRTTAIHEHVSQLIKNGKITAAWQVLLTSV